MDPDIKQGRLAAGPEADRNTAAGEPSPNATAAVPAIPVPIVQAQPVPVVAAGGGGRGGAGGGWESGVFDCSGDEEACWWSCWCSCLVLSRTYHSFGIADSKRTCGGFCAMLALWFIWVVARVPGFGLVLLASLCALFLHRARLRSALRQQLGIPGDLNQDCFLHCCCIPCVVAQEARQAKVAGRPYADFGTGEALTAADLVPDAPRGATLCEHSRRLSMCTKIMSVCTLLIFAIASLIWHQKEGSLMYVLVFIPPFVILYFVYWRNNRHEVPLDTVLKLFFAGATVAVLAAVVFEPLLELAGLLLFGGPGALEPANLRKHMAKIIILIFLNAFVVAAGVEEFVKHFVVRGCWLPHDLASPTAINIALVAGALGFATTENLEYVFGSAVAGAGKFESELLVLGLRSLFPIHAMCASLQAVEVVRRDYERGGGTPLWRILLPAVTLHGVFDFTQFLIPLCFYAYESNLSEVEQAAVALSVGLVVTVIGAVYLFRVRHAQARRLGDGWRRVGQGDDDVSAVELGRVGEDAEIDQKEGIGQEEEEEEEVEMDVLASGSE